MELMVVMGITVVLGGIGVANYFNYQSVQVLDGAASELAGTLRDAHQRAVSQDNSSAWGVNIVNTADDSAGDYYEFFYGDSRVSGTVVSKTVLAAGLKFLVPNHQATDNKMEIVFAKSTGFPGADYTITIVSARDSSLSRTTQINKTPAL